MSLVTMKKILDEAKAKKYAVGAFEFWSLDSVRAIIEAAEECNMPVILQAGPTELNFMDWDAVAGAIPKLCEKAAIDIAIHLDHSEEIKWVKMAIESGFTSVMIDSSKECFEKNVEITKEVVALARPHGITVESELGRLPGAEGAISVDEAEAFQTTTKEAIEFVNQTGIDCLAVAVGTVHGFYKATPKINIQRIKELSECIDIPLVLHGGSGTPDDIITEAINAGISKVNVCTEFMDAFGKGYYNVQTKTGYHPSIKGLFEPAFLNGKELIKTKIKLFKGLHVRKNTIQ